MVITGSCRLSDNIDSRSSDDLVYAVFALLLSHVSPVVVCCTVFNINHMIILVFVAFHEPGESLLALLDLEARKLLGKQPLAEAGRAGN